jgi:hypothetical protein
MKGNVSPGPRVSEISLCGGLFHVHFYLFILAVLEIELRASHLLYHLSHAPSPFVFSLFF